jgi:large subunit ribosomal protein L29
VKLRELKDLSLDELKTRERELVDEVFHLRLKRATAQLPNPMKMRETRRTLARVKTRGRCAKGWSCPTRWTRPSS